MVYCTAGSGDHGSLHACIPKLFKMKVTFIGVFLFCVLLACHFICVLSLFCVYVCARACLHTCVCILCVCLVFGEDRRRR